MTEYELYEIVIPLCRRKEEGDHEYSPATESSPGGNWDPQTRTLTISLANPEACKDADTITIKLPKESLTDPYTCGDLEACISLHRNAVQKNPFAENPETDRMDGPIFVKIKLHGHCTWAGTFLSGRLADAPDAGRLLFSATPEDPNCPERSGEACDGYDGEAAWEIVDNSSVVPGMQLNAWHSFDHLDGVIESACGTAWYHTPSITGGRIVSMKGEYDDPGVTYDVEVEGAIIVARPSDFVPYKVGEWVFLGSENDQGQLDAELGGGIFGGDRETNNFLLIHNRHRLGIGRRTLRWSTELEAAAQRHADDLAANKRTGHTGTDGSKPADRIKDAGYYDENTESGELYENMARFFAGTSDETVFQGWLDSPSHRQAIEDSDMEDFGIGIATDDIDQVYYVTCFGTKSKNGDAQAVIFPIKIGGAAPEANREYLPINYGGDSLAVADAVFGKCKIEEITGDGTIRIHWPPEGWDGDPKIVEKEVHFHCQERKDTDQGNTAFYGEDVYAVVLIDGWRSNPDSEKAVIVTPHGGLRKCAALILYVTTNGRILKKEIEITLRDSRDETMHGPEPKSPSTGIALFDRPEEEYPFLYPIHQYWGEFHQPVVECPIVDAKTGQPFVSGEEGDEAFHVNFEVPWETWDMGLVGMHDWVGHIETRQPEGEARPEDPDLWTTWTDLPDELENPDVSPGYIVSDGKFQWRPPGHNDPRVEWDDSLNYGENWSRLGYGELKLVWSAGGDDPKINPAKTPWAVFDFASVVRRLGFTEWQFTLAGYGPRLSIYLAEKVAVVDDPDYPDAWYWSIPEDSKYIRFVVMAMSSTWFQSHPDSNQLTLKNETGERTRILPGLPREDEDQSSIPFDPAENWEAIYAPYQDGKDSYGNDLWFFPERAKTEIPSMGDFRTILQGPIKSVFDLRDYGIDWEIGAVIIDGYGYAPVRSMSFQLESIDFLEAYEFDLTEEQQALFDLHNEHRDGAELHAFRWDPKLEAAARRHAEDMALNLLFDHIGSDGSGPILRIREAGFFRGGASTEIGYENIVARADGSEPSEVFQALVEEGTNRETIENAALEDIGIAAATDSEGLRYYVLCYGTVSA